MAPAWRTSTKLLFDISCSETLRCQASTSLSNQCICHEVDSRHLQPEYPSENSRSRCDCPQLWQLAQQSWCKLQKGPARPDQIEHGVNGTGHIGVGSRTRNPPFWASRRSNAIAACTLRRMCKVSSASPAELGLTGRNHSFASWDFKSPAANPRSNSEQNGVLADPYATTHFACLGTGRSRCHCCSTDCVQLPPKARATKHRTLCAAHVERPASANARSF